MMSGLDTQYQMMDINRLKKSRFQQYASQRGWGSDAEAQVVWMEMVDKASEVQILTELTISIDSK